MTTSEPLAAQQPVHLRELDHRASDGIEVSLLWNPRTDDVLVSLTLSDGFGFAFQVAPAEALRAFNHPYGYAPFAEHMPLAA